MPTSANLLNDDLSRFGFFLRGDERFGPSKSAPPVKWFFLFYLCVFAPLREPFNLFCFFISIQN